MTNVPIEEPQVETFQHPATCGDCFYCQDNGPDPGNPAQRLSNCHAVPPVAVPMANAGQGVAVMSVRPSVKPTDTACEKGILKDSPIVPPTVNH